MVLKYILHKYDRRCDLDYVDYERVKLLTFVATVMDFSSQQESSRPILFI
jgi:hypothetical protein